MRGLTIVGVHSFGKGGASVGLITTACIIGTELTLLASMGHKLQLCQATHLHRL